MPLAKAVMNFKSVRDVAFVVIASNQFRHSRRIARIVQELYRMVLILELT